MREILIEYARARNRQKRGGEFKTQIALDDAVSFTNAKLLDIIAVDKALNALEKLDAQQSRIVEMKFFVRKARKRKILLKSGEIWRELSARKIMSEKSRQKLDEISRLRAS